MEVSQFLNLDKCLICWFVLIVWYKTSAFVEYLDYFNLGGRLIYDYRKKKERSSNLHFTTFLLIHRNSFFVRLICCPICLMVWLNVILSLIYLDFTNFFSDLLIVFILYFSSSALLKVNEN